MANELQGKRVAILAADMVEQVELVEPRKALEDAGATVELVSIRAGEIQGFDHFDPAAGTGRQARSSRGGRRRLRRADDPGRRRQPRSAPRRRERGRVRARLLRAGQARRRRSATAPWTARSRPDVVRGRTLTSWPTLPTDIRNAGGEWVDEEVVVDYGLVTSRKPDDIPAFNAKMIEEFADGRHERQGAAVPPSDRVVARRRGWRRGLEPPTTGTTTRGSTN